MVYSVVSSEDKNAVSMEFFSSKKIPLRNMHSVGSLNVLAEQLVLGDVVWVVDVNRFGSVITYWNFYQICKQKGVSIKFLANPYLNYAKDKRLKGSYEKLIVYMISIEQKIATDICRAFNDVNVAEVQRYAGCISVNILGQIFSTDGILKRTSA